jgi:hypothetical protein
MRIELDHLFVCTTAGAPEGERLVQFGLREGSSNQHPGQGTANRRFPFANAMIELLWVSNTGEAQAENTRRTLLWERWRGREGGASPFGICVRPIGDPGAEAPFPSWEYRPAYLADPLFMCIGDAGLDEPMWIYMSFLRKAHHEQRFLEHPIGIRAITGLTLTNPAPFRSKASQKIVESGILRTRNGPASLLEVEFDGNPRREHMDFRPRLPLIFHM